MCVIIPVHKPVLTVFEQASLLACADKLSLYDCYLVFPEGMDVGLYTSLFDGLLLMPVNPAWLSSVEMYNKMKLNLQFYKKFSNYHFMLTYELDAYIFDAGFERINAFAFDFIGAPFFEGYWAAKPGSPFIKGCNSGFSIRNIQSCIRVLSSIKKYRFHWLLFKLTLLHSSRLRLRLNKLTRNKYHVFISGRFAFNFANFHLNEDVVWTEVAPQLFHFFTVADPLSALKFSFEYNLEKSVELNGGQLPLGCHAWAKHLDFWKEYINY